MADVNDLIAKGPQIEAANATAAPTLDLNTPIKNAVGVREALRTDAAQTQAVDMAQSVRDAYANADTTTTEGRGALVGKLYSIDPNQAQAAAKSFNDQDKTKADTANLYAQVRSHLATADMNTAKTALDKATGVNDAFGAMQIFAQANKDNPDAVNANYHAAVMDMANKGLINQNELGHFPPDYDPNFVQSHATMSKTFQDAATAEVERKQKAALAAQEQTEADKNTVQTKKTQAEIDAGLPAAEAAAKRGSAAQGFAAAAKDKAQATVAGKKEVVIQGADGKPSVGVLDMTTGQVTDTGTPASSVKGSNPTTPQMRRDNATIVRAANEVGSTLDRLGKVQFTTPGLISADKAHPHGWIDTLFMPSAVPYIQKKLSSEDSNNINALQAGVSRQLSTLETIGSGRGPTQANTNQLEQAEMIAAGDTVGNVRFKTAMWAAHVRQALEGIDEESLTAPQLSVVNKVKQQISKIPDPGDLFSNGAPKDKSESMVAGQPTGLPTGWSVKQQ